jgi:hypothetical protein
MSMSKEELVASMEEILANFQHVQQEDQSFHDYVMHL